MSEEVDLDGEVYPVPEARPETLGVTRGRPDLCMPPFAVDSHGGQGNGDMTDGVIALRGKILNDFAGSTQPEASVYMVAANPSEASIIAAALELAAKQQDFLVDIHTLTWSDDSAVEVNRLAERFRMVPGALGALGEPQTVTWTLRVEVPTGTAPSDVIEILREQTDVISVDWRGEDTSS